VTPLAIALALASACAGHSNALLTRLAEPPCAPARRQVEWVGPENHGDRVRLSAWCQSVGAAFLIDAAIPDPSRDVQRDGLVVGTWNIHEGGGDVERLLDFVRAESGDSDRDPDVVLLLQEVVRAAEDVPVDVPAGVRAPGRIRPDPAPSHDLAAIARRRGLALAYVPSMRNGGGTTESEREDRGSAILSTLPLSDVTGIELPWVRQRRVAVMATITARRDERVWRWRVISVHFDNRPRRAGQAEALARFAATVKSDDLPLVIGGDLNTWFGVREDTVQQIDAVVPRIAECGRKPTFRFGRRLDHLFTTIPPSSRRRCVVTASTFGSDHHPTLLYLFR
jgi:endonuclease/exonuclease/phosphatase family metal-dependent hydrolase